MNGAGILVIGAGGHGKVAADILLAEGTRVLGFLDDDPERRGQTVLGLPVLGEIASYASLDPSGLVMGIGDNRTRAAIAARLGSHAATFWRPAIHPRATIAPSARIGNAVFIAAGAVINPDAVVGDFVVVNTGATVDHDCELGNFTHVGPGVHLCGAVRAGTGALIGVGACVAPGRTVGEWAVVGAGSVVVRDVPAGVVAKGAPARW